MEVLNKPRLPFKPQYIYTAGGALVVIIAALLLVVFLNTDDGSGGESVPADSPILSVPGGSYERVLARAGALTISDFETVGIKTTQQHDVTNLWGAIDAWSGFRRVSGTSPAEFELRFYTNHSSAVSNGTFYAEDVTGEDANLLSTNSAWTQGIEDRVIRDPFTRDGGKFVPKYMDYAVYGNIVMLCEGKTAAESQAACRWLIDQLDQQP